MTIYGTILPGAASIARSAIMAGNLTERAKYRIKVLDWHKEHKSNISLTARRFGLTRKTVRAWTKKFQEKGLFGLSEQS